MTKDEIKKQHANGLLTDREATISLEALGFTRKASERFLQIVGTDALVLEGTAKRSLLFGLS